MAFDPGPPPKRSDYLTKATYDMVRARWKQDKDAWRAEQRRLRQQERLGQFARDQANLRNGYGWNKYTETQDKTEDWHVKVHPGYDDIRNTFTTDVQIYDRHSKGSHQHIVYDEYGNEIYNEWTERG